MADLNVNSIGDASGGTTTTVNGFTPTASNMAGRNLIINGDMRIDQRNAGASVTPNASYTLDRWIYENTQTGKATVQQNAGSVTPPTGFTNYLGVTSASAYSVLTGDTFLLGQRIEGYNVADLAWGTANAQTVTFSFWVRSSLTGAFGGALQNVNATRSYPFSYTISSADTWEYKTVTVAGDTSGTWNTGNGRGLYVIFGLGSGATYSGTAGAWATANIVQPTSTVSVVGTSGATLYITGVQLEAGSVATPFEHRQYGQELALCQRYYEKSYNQSVVPGTSGAGGNRWLSNAGGSSTNRFFGNFAFAVPKRINGPSLDIYTSTGIAGRISKYNASSTTLLVSSVAGTSENSIGSYIQTSTGDSSEPFIFHFTADAEL